MMKHFIIFLTLITFSWGCKKEKSATKETSEQTAQNPDEGWVSLFDGKSFDGWHTYLKDTISDQWQIIDSAMYFSPDPDKDPGLNNLVTDKKYSSFVLSMEYKIAVDGNSGVFYGVFEDEKFVVPYMTAPEIQIRDYTNDPDFNNMKQMSGAVFGLVGPDKDYTNKAGEWNHFLITIDYNKNLGQVALNGHEIVSYPLRGEAWDAMVQDSKFKDWEGFGIYSEGHIGLQDHGHDVWFRNLKIKELNE